MFFTPNLSSLYLFHLFSKFSSSGGIKWILNIFFSLSLNCYYYRLDRVFIQIYGILKQSILLSILWAFLDWGMLWKKYRNKDIFLTPYKYKSSIFISSIVFLSYLKAWMIVDGSAADVRKNNFAF